jgi:hypothetical protein
MWWLMRGLGGKQKPLTFELNCFARTVDETPRVTVDDQLLLYFI